MQGRDETPLVCEKKLQQLYLLAEQWGRRKGLNAADAEDVAAKFRLHCLHRVCTGVDPDALALAAHFFVRTEAARLRLRNRRFSSLADPESDAGEWCATILVPGPDAEVERGEEHCLLCAAIRQLPPEQRHVIVRRCFHDAPFTAIAGELGKTEDNIRQILFRARRHLCGRFPAVSLSA